MIVVTSVLAGLDTEKRISGTTVVFFLEQLVQTVFILECSLKIIAENVYPHLYFNSPWNILDFVVIFVSLLTDALGTSGKGIILLRLLRLIRLLRIMKRFQQLQVILHSLVNSVKAVVIIGKY